MSITSLASEGDEHDYQQAEQDGEPTLRPSDLISALHRSVAHTRVSSLGG